MPVTVPVDSHLEVGGIDAGDGLVEGHRVGHAGAPVIGAPAMVRLIDCTKGSTDGTIRPSSCSNIGRNNGRTTARSSRQRSAEVHFRPAHFTSLDNQRGNVGASSIRSNAKPTRKLYHAGRADAKQEIANNQVQRRHGVTRKGYTVAYLRKSWPEVSAAAIQEAVSLASDRLIQHYRDQTSRANSSWMTNWTCR